MYENIDFDTAVQAAFHAHEAQSLIQGSSREADLVGGHVAFEDIVHVRSYH